MSIVLPINAEFINPQANLFEVQEGSLHLSEPFTELLSRLVPDSLESVTFEEFTSKIQAAFLRPAGVGRWQMQDTPDQIANEGWYRDLFKRMGYEKTQELTENVNVDFALIFGARVLAMEKRILATLEQIKKGTLKARKISLLGCKRPLLPEEQNYLGEALETEADAFLFLWKKHAPPTLNVQVIVADVPNTEGTILAWLPTTSKDPSVFAFIEQPYLRVLDHLKTLAPNATFHFAIGKATKPP